MSVPESFIVHLPNLLEISNNFTFAKNRHFDEILKESKDWIRNYSGQYEAQFFHEDLELLSAYGFPYVDAELLKLVVDYNNYLFLTDELADENEEVAKKFGPTVMSVVNDLEAEPDSLIGVATKDILLRIKSLCRSYEFEMICKNLRYYIKITAEETKRRKNRIVLDLATYKKQRPILAGCEIWYTLAIVINKVDIPQEIYENEDFMKVHDSASEMLWIGNDVYSFAKEYRKNVYDTNLVTILMKAYNYSIQESFDEVGRIYQELQDTFMESKQRLLETINHPEVNRFIECLETFIIGNLEWSATTTRYVEKGEDIKGTHQVKLYKRHDHY